MGDETQDVLHFLVQSQKKKALAEANVLLKSSFYSSVSNFFSSEMSGKNWINT
jgi:hypothetical protein